MKHLSILIALILLIHTGTTAQEPSVGTGDSHRSIGIKTGISGIRQQDLIFSPFIHHDWSFPSVSGFFESKRKHYNNLTLRYSAFNPNKEDAFDYIEEGETKTTYPHSFSFINLQYLFGFNIKNSNQTTIFAGPGFLTDVHALNYSYGRISNFGYYSSFSIGGFIYYHQSITPVSSISANIKIPIVSWLSRSPYLVNDDQFIENISSHSGFKTFMAYLGDGHLTSLNKIQAIDIDATYHYAPFKRWTFSGGWNFKLIRVTEPRLFVLFQNTFNVGAAYKF